MKRNYLLKKCTLIIFILTITSCNLAPGSYSNSQDYELDVKESVLIETIKEFKNNSPEYNVPEYLHIKDGRNDENDLWYHIYFYYKDKNQILNTWTRASDNGRTTFAFVCINQGLQLGNWKDVNKNFTEKENKEIIKEFENRILSKVKKSLNL